MSDIYVWFHLDETYVGNEKACVSLHGYASVNPSKYGWGNHLVPIKVVPNDSVVLNPAWIKSKSEANAGGARVQGNIYYEKLLYESYEIILPTPTIIPTPMAEPKGFGAVVEADMEFGNAFGSRFRFVRVARNKWIVQGNAKSIYYWSDLVSKNPALISKGVE